MTNYFLLKYHYKLIDLNIFDRFQSMIFLILTDAQMIPSLVSKASSSS